MHFSIVAGIISTCLTSSALAGGLQSLVGYNAFSIGTFQKHVESLKTHQDVVELRNVFLKKGKLQGCPSLEDSTITLISVNGEKQTDRYFSAPKYDLYSEAVTSVGDLDQIKYVYHVNGGKCGYITVYKMFHEDVKNAKAIFLPELKDDSDCPGCSEIPLENLKLDADQALQLAIEKYPQLEKGFHDLKLSWNRGYEQPKYVFAGLELQPLKIRAGESWNFGPMHRTGVHVSIGAETGIVEVNHRPL